MKKGLQISSCTRKHCSVTTHFFCLLAALILSCTVGVKADPQAADSLTSLKAKAESGDAASQFNLGVEYADGNGVAKDPVQAVMWFRKAAQQGNASAQFNLGVCYDTGLGVDKDMTEAVRWYRKAADQGHVTAEFNLGACLYDGIGVQENKPEAIKWYIKAANQGNQGAQRNLGLLYIKGLGVIKNEVEGLAWLYVAGANGDQSVVDQLSNYERLYGGDVEMAARRRAAELQTQIASHLDPGGDDAIPSNQPNSAADSVKETGSGVFISSDGLFLTAAHVIEGFTSLRVVTQNGTMNAKVVQMDRANDVALLKCEGTFVPVQIKSSSSVKLGQTVFTLGFPDIQIQGFSPKMTKGEISSLLGVQDDPRQWQISVPVQPGNSGGPLFDEQGNLVGLIEAKLDAVAMANATGDVPQNVNYALKSAYLMPMLDPYTAELPITTTSPLMPQKMEDVVSKTTPSIGLVLVY